MRKLFLPLVLVLTLSMANAQTPAYKGITALPIDAASKKVTYTGVIEVPGIAAGELYSRALVWATKNKGDVNQVNEKQEGTVISGVNSFKTPAKNTAVYDYVFEFKDGKIRYTISDFILVYSGGRSPLETFYPAKTRPKIGATYDAEIAALNEAIQKEIAVFGGSVSKKDW